MKKYHLLVNGRNFLIAEFGPEPKAKGYYQLEYKPIAKSKEPHRLKKVGFYTNMCVSARDPQEAETKAVAILRKDKALMALALNSREDQPRLFVEEITEIESFKDCRRPRDGLGFYEEKPRKPKRTSNQGRTVAPRGRRATSG